MTNTNQTKWKIDAGHSELQFKVKHLGISNVAGTFKVFKGTVVSEDDEFKSAEVEAVIETGSLDTNNAQRDEHLRSDIFFNVQQYPEMVFKGALERKDDQYLLTGEITIKDTTRKILLTGEFNGIGKGRFNDLRAGFEVTGKINRKDFGLSWNILTETGAFVLGDEIKLHLAIQLIKE